MILTNNKDLTQLLRPNAVSAAIIAPTWYPGDALLLLLDLAETGIRAALLPDQRAGRDVLAGNRRPAEDPPGQVFSSGYYAPI